MVCLCKMFDSCWLLGLNDTRAKLQPASSSSLFHLCNPIWTAPSFSPSCSPTIELKIDLSASGRHCQSFSRVGASVAASKHAANFRFNARPDFRFDLHTLAAFVSYLGHVRVRVEARVETLFASIFGAPIENFGRIRGIRIRISRFPLHCFVRKPILSSQMEAMDSRCCLKLWYFEGKKFAI